MVSPPGLVAGEDMLTRLLNSKKASAVTFRSVNGQVVTGANAAAFRPPPAPAALLEYFYLPEMLRLGALCKRTRGFLRASDWAFRPSYLVYAADTVSMRISAGQPVPPFALLVAAGCWDGSPSRWRECSMLSLEMAAAEAAAVANASSSGEDDGGAAATRSQVAVLAKTIGLELTMRVLSAASADSSARRTDADRAASSMCVLRV